MSKHSLDQLFTAARNIFDRIKTLLKHQTTSDLDTQIGNWKSQLDQLLIDADKKIRRIESLLKHLMTSDLNRQIENYKYEVEKLLTDTHDIFSRIEMLLKHQTTADLYTQMGNWKSQLDQLLINAHDIFSHIEMLLKHQKTSDVDTQIGNYKSLLDYLRTHTDETFSHRKMLLKHQITRALDIQIKNYKYAFEKLLTDAHNIFSDIEKLLKDPTTQDIHAQIKTHKSEFDELFTDAREKTNHIEKLLEHMTTRGFDTQIGNHKYLLDYLRTYAHDIFNCIDEMLLKRHTTSNSDIQIENSKSQLDQLLIDADETFSCIEMLPKHQITSDLDTQIRKWKSQIADVCLALVQEPSQTLQPYSFDTPGSDYCIDLRATSHILPRRLKGQPQQIDETTRRNRSLHEAEIQNGNIICYRATDDGKLVAFETRSRSVVGKALEVLSFAHELHYFNFPKLTKQVTSIYDIKYCAHPECGKLVETEGDHLRLCQDHSAELMDNIERKWLPAASKDIYRAIKNVGKHDSQEIHHRIYYQLLPQLNTWIEQIDRIIPTDCTGTGTQTSSVDAWLVLQLRPMRLLLTLMKSFIFLYRMHLNPMADIIAAIIALGVDALKCLEVIKATVDGFVRIIRAVCGTFAAIFAYVGIGILYTLDLIFSDDAYIAIILKSVGGVLAITGAAVVVIAATPVAIIVDALAIAGGAAIAITGTPVVIIGGICVGTVGITSFLIGSLMGRERDRRGVPHTHLIQVHLDLRLARERLWQWIG